MTRAVLVLSSPDVRQKAAHWVGKLPPGTRVEFKAPKRSLPQNDLIFLDALKREVRMVPNLDGNGFVSLGRSSSDLSKAEMTDLIDLIGMFGANHGVTFHD
jgi:hypothetical protein